jgi:hypothetical protein
LPQVNALPDWPLQNVGPGKPAANSLMRRNDGHGNSEYSTPEGQTLKSSDLTKEILVCLSLSIAFGIFVCALSNKLVSRQDRRSESVEMERNILRGLPFHHAGWFYSDPDFLTLLLQSPFD